MQSAIETEQLVIQPNFSNARRQNFKGKKETLCISQAAADRSGNEEGAVKLLKRSASIRDDGVGCNIMSYKKLRRL